MLDHSIQLDCEVGDKHVQLQLYSTGGREVYSISSTVDENFGYVGVEAVDAASLWLR